MRLVLHVLLILGLAVPALADQVPALPNPLVTPGAVDPSATLDVICDSTTRQRRHVTASEKNAVLDAYNIPRAQAPYYEFDHLIPLAICGANSIANLWPQPWAEADQKDALEVELQRRVCGGEMSQAKAQREIADDWTVAYRRYVGGTPAAAKGYDARPNRTAPGCIRQKFGCLSRGGSIAISVQRAGPFSDDYWPAEAVARLNQAPTSAEIDCEPYAVRKGLTVLVVAA